MINLTQLEEQRALLVKNFEGWSAARLSYCPSSDAWSATEVFDHLVKTEEAILEQAEQGLAKPHRLHVRDRLGNLLVMKIFQSGRRVKVPASASQMLPTKSHNLESVLNRWRKTREDLQRLHSQVTPEQARLGLFRHPVAGWMTMQQIVEFFAVHMTHHNFQLVRLSQESQAIGSSAS